MNIRHLVMSGYIKGIDDYFAGITLLERYNALNTFAEISDSLLSYAVVTKRYNVLRYLLQKGADPCKADKYGFTVMHFAVRFNDLKSIDIILNYRSYAVNCVAEECNISVLSLAIKSNSYDTILLLRKFFVDVRKSDVELARNMKNKKILQLLHKSNTEIYKEWTDACNY